MNEAAEAHSKKHLEEAGDVTIFGSDAQIELQLGHVCNNRCVFCVSGQLTEQRLAKQIPVEPVLKAIEDGASRGSKRVTFLGGEPTTQRSFMPALRRAVELGYEQIVIFTNGVRTRKPEFIDKIIALGGNYEWRFSVQGGTREAHDAVTLREGSFDRIVAGMRYVAEIGQDVTINMCVNEYSYESLPHFPELCREYKVRQLHIDQIRPSDAGARDDAYFLEIMTQYSKMAPYFAAMLEGFEAMDPDYDVNLGNFPYCQLPEWAHKIHHDGQATLTYPADGVGNFCDPFDKYPTKRADKGFAPQCDKCAFKSQCNGIFDKYAELYGTEEFVPVSLERLAELDDKGHFFVLLVEPALKAFFEAQPPASWKADEVFRNTRDRVIETRYLDAEGRRATLVITPPEGQGKTIEIHAPLMETNHFRVSLLLDDGIAPEAVESLMAWAVEHLSSHWTVEITRPTDWDRLRVSLLPAAELQRVQAKLARLIARIQRHGDFGEHTCTSIRPADVGFGSVLEFGGDEGTLVSVILSVELDGDRPRVGVRYELADGTQPAVARPLLTDVMTALRA
jgi:MoaA/NifB/PqqE/SkfB family radical SAM enzyme